MSELYAQRFFGQGGSAPIDFILSYPFGGNLLDGSTNSNNGIGTGAYSFVAGRKGYDTAISFTNGLIATSNTVNIGTDKCSICFWMKSSQATVGIPFELSVNFNGINAFNCTFSGILAGRIDVSDWNSGYNVWSNPSDIRGGWHFVVFTLDRSQPTGALCTNIYVDNILTAKINGYGLQDNLGGAWANNKMYFGDRYSVKPASVAPYVGLIQEFKLFNRILTASEMTAIYNL